MAIRFSLILFPRQIRHFTSGVSAAYNYPLPYAYIAHAAHQSDDAKGSNLNSKGEQENWVHDDGEEKNRRHKKGIALTTIDAF